MKAKVLSKAKFKPRALEYFREVEATGREIIITDRNRPVVRVIPYREDPDEALLQLKDSVVKYELPLEPVGLEEWDLVE